MSHILQRVSASSSFYLPPSPSPCSGWLSVGCKLYYKEYRLDPLLLTVGCVFTAPFTHSLFSGSRWAAGRGGNCPSCRVAELQEPRPCQPSRDTGRSQHVPPSGLTTTRRPSDGEDREGTQNTRSGGKNQGGWEWKKRVKLDKEKVLISAPQWACL